jgi:hypothetical protein
LELGKTEGLVGAEMWHVAARVTFETDNTRKKITALRIEPVTSNQ